MEFKYKEEILAERIKQEFYSDTKGMWSQRELPSIEDFIKWAIMRGYIK